jgi:hypothetical protein
MKPSVPEKFIRLGGPPQQLIDDLGPLASLVGKWVGSKGWNIIAVPAPGSEPNTEGDFQLLVRPYTETITFGPVGAPVRNRGGALDQFVGALEYELRINDLETAEVLHVENGMWLYLGDIQPDSGAGTSPIPPFTLARSASIPHGDSALILGNFSTANGAPVFPIIDTRPPDIGKPTELGYLDPYSALVEGLNVINPDATLQADIEGQNILSTTTLVLDSANQGGIQNVPFIVNHANATRFQCFFWIETVQVPDSDQTFQQLQYTQIIDLEFHKKFGGVPGLITWPHVNINTLRKQ